MKNKPLYLFSANRKQLRQKMAQIPSKAKLTQIQQKVTHSRINIARNQKFIEEYEKLLVQIEKYMFRQEKIFRQLKENVANIELQLSETAYHKTAILKLQYQITTLQQQTKRRKEPMAQYGNELAQINKRIAGSQQRQQLDEQERLQMEEEIGKQIARLEELRRVLQEYSRDMLPRMENYLQEEYREGVMTEQIRGLKPAQANRAKVDCSSPKLMEVLKIIYFRAHTLLLKNPKAILKMSDDKLDEVYSFAEFKNLFISLHLEKRHRTEEVAQQEGIMLRLECDPLLRAEVEQVCRHMCVCVEGQYVFTYRGSSLTICEEGGGDWDGERVLVIQI